MIRPFGLRDILTIRRLLARGVAFDLRRLLLSASSPTSAALFGYFTHNQLGTVTCMNDDSDGGLKGFAQVRPRADRAEWDLAFLAPSLDQHKDASRLWHELLSHLIILGASHDILRIYARSSEDAEVEDVLRGVGFTLVTREEVFSLSFIPAQPPSLNPPTGLRPVEREDRWALSELWRQVVPPLVRQAHGDSPYWGAGAHRILKGPAPAQEFVWIERGEIAAYLGLSSGPRGHWLDIIVRPEHRADLLPHIGYVLSLTQCSASAPLYCPVADNSIGLGWVLRTLKFESHARQVTFVVHTAARVPVRRPIVIPSLEAGIDVGTPVGHINSGRGDPNT